MNGAILQKRCNLHPCCKLCHAIDLIPDSLGIIHNRRRHFFDFLTLPLSYISSVLLLFVGIFLPIFLPLPHSKMPTSFMDGILLVHVYRSALLLRRDQGVIAYKASTLGQAL